ncbi:MAG: hypothetical protein MN733_40750, partial [Nitrososphaera sp.]|nr:hypothetical protein [Nitrososphaera sp.]
EIHEDSEHRRKARAREWPCLARRGCNARSRAQRSRFFHKLSEQWALYLCRGASLRAERKRAMVVLHCITALPLAVLKQAKEAN